MISTPNNESRPMSDEVEQLKRKVKQQRLLIVWLSITLTCFSVCLMISLWESRTDQYRLQRLKVKIEQLEKDFQKIEKAIELKAEMET